MFEGRTEHLRRRRTGPGLTLDSRAASCSLKLQRMPGPKTPVEVRKWAREAVTAGRYIPSVHFKDRCREYGVFMADVHSVIGRCRIVEPYSAPPKNGGTCWRLWGSNVDGTLTFAVGVEAFRDGLGAEMLMLCTVLPPRKKR